MKRYIVYSTTGKIVGEVIADSKDNALEQAIKAYGEGVIVVIR